MEALKAAIPLQVGAVTLVPIERTDISCSAGDAGCWTGAVKEPFAIVVCDACGVRAFALDSSELALDDLIDDTPNLAEMLAKL